MNDFDKIKREPLLNKESYLDSIDFKHENFIVRTIESVLSDPKRSDINKKGRSWDWAYTSLEFAIERYSGGEPITDLLPYVERALDQFNRHFEAYPMAGDKLNPWEPDAYQYILWLLSFSVLFGMPERVPQIAAWINTEPEENKDSFLRQVFARLGVNLPDGRLLHEKPYADLQISLSTEGDEQQQLICRYLRSWYRSLKRCYWHGRDKRQEAGFFGYWAFEAGMVTVLWDIDDTVYRDLPYYPKDLVDYARAKHVADHFPQGRPIGAPGMTAKSGEECPCTGVWTCDDWAVGPQTFSRGITLPTDSGRQVTWRLTKVI